MNIVILFAVLEMLREEYPEAHDLIEQLELTIAKGCPIPRLRAA
jgi:hypothetical protein